MLISLLHRTTFVYAGKAHDSFNEVRLRPVDDAGQVCRSFELRTEPAANLRDYVDFYGNTVHYFDIAEGHDRLMIEALSAVETTPNAARPPVPQVPNVGSGSEREMVAEYLAGSHYVPLEVEVWKEAKDALSGGRSDVWSDVRAICGHVFRKFAYKPRSTGVATLAKGPVAPFLAAIIIIAFAFLRREWSILRRTLWWPGVALYFAMVLPWFIAVQRQNPTFFREFFFEHNLLRFATDRYQHVQPFWYYVPVALLAIMPWTVIAVRALADGIQTSVREWRLRHSSVCKPCAGAPGDAFPEFLVLWALIPIVFFSFSRSKLPGYILPSIPPIAILTGDYLFRRRQAGLNRWVLLGHVMLCGVTTMAVLLLPWFVAHGSQMPPTNAIVAAALAACGAALLILVVVNGFGVARLRLVTTGVLVVLVFFLYGVGPFFGSPEVVATKRVIHLLDRSYSARLLADRLAAYASASETIAVFRVRRDTEYGLSFYRNREVVNYEESGVPDEQHLLVVRVSGRGGVDLHTQEALDEYFEGRHFEQLFTWPEQGLVIYMVGGR